MLNCFYFRPKGRVFVCQSRKGRVLILKYEKGRVLILKYEKAGCQITRACGSTPLNWLGQISNGCARGRQRRIALLLTITQSSVKLTALTRALWQFQSHLFATVATTSPVSASRRPSSFLLVLSVAITFVL